MANCTVVEYRVVSEPITTPDSVFWQRKDEPALGGGCASTIGGSAILLDLIRAACTARRS